MSARTAAYKIYFVFTLLVLAGCTWWLMRVRKAMPEDEAIIENEPAKHVPAPEYERFPYERGGAAVVIAVRSGEITGEVPTLWIRGNGVIVRKSDEFDDSLVYERAVLPKKAIDGVLARLLDGAHGLDSPRGAVVVTLTGKSEVRTFRLPGIEAIVQAAADVMRDGVKWKPARLASIRLTATEIDAEDGERWPVARLPLGRIIREGPLESTVPDVNATIQKRARTAGVYAHDGKSWLVTAVPVVDR